MHVFLASGSFSPCSHSGTQLYVIYCRVTNHTIKTNDLTQFLMVRDLGVGLLGSSGESLS